MEGTKITYRDCPVCTSNHISRVFGCKDWLVTGEIFDLWQCDDCSLRFTQDAPAADAIGKYYQSENYISHSDSGSGLINGLYKTARRFTLASKRKLVIKNTGLRNGRLLDTGCGTGAFFT